MVNSNRAAGVAVIQSAQLTRLVGNCVRSNGRAGIMVDQECRVELRGNGIYANGYHGVCFRGEGQIVENDVAGNGAIGIRLMESADVKVRHDNKSGLPSTLRRECEQSMSFNPSLQVLRNRVQSLRGCAISVRERVRGVIQENLVYQGYPDNNKPHIYTHALSQECVVLSNTLLTHR